MNEGLLGYGRTNSSPWEELVAERVAEPMPIALRGPSLDADEPMEAVRRGQHPENIDGGLPFQPRLEGALPHEGVDDEARPVPPLILAGAPQVPELVVGACC